MADSARIRLLGADPIKVQAAMNATDEVSLRWMRWATENAQERVEREWKAISPVQTGEYRRSIRSLPVHDVGGVIVGEVVNTSGHADFVERGTGLYRAGPGSRRKIRPRDPDGWLAIPADRLSIGGSRRKGGGRMGVRFVKSIKGQRAQWVARRARVTTRPLIAPYFKVAAHRAKYELKGRM